MTQFEQEVIEDLSMAITAVNDSNMDKRAQIVCLSALYLFAWLADNEKETLRVAFAHILANLTFQV
jgi:hypothetical protein